MSKFKRTIIAVRGDTQGGHGGGLLNPDTQFPEIEIDEAGKQVVIGWHSPSLRPVQKRLWRWHKQDLENIRNLAGKDEIVFIEMGDLTQGNRFLDDLAEAALDAQILIAEANCMPLLEIPNVRRLRIVKGTGVHVWGNGSTENILTRLLSKAYPKKSVKIADHWLLDLDGFLIDVAHHGPGPGIRNWLYGNVFDLYLKSILKDDIDSGVKPPNLVLRAHNHHFIYRRAIHQVRENIWELPGFISPPYCFIGGHAQKVMNSPSSMGVGMMAVEVVDGKFKDWYKFTHSVNLRTQEIL